MEIVVANRPLRWDQINGSIEPYDADEETCIMVIKALTPYLFFCRRKLQFQLDDMLTNMLIAWKARLMELRLQSMNNV